MSAITAHVAPVPVPVLAVDEATAAELLSVAPMTLRSWRSRGDGPAYVKAGRRVVYRVADLEGWLLERREGGDSA